MAAASALRLFFALQPPRAARDALCASAQAAFRDGRIVPAANLHLTLAFLGDVPPALLGEVTAAAARRAVSRFNLDFGTVGYWPRSRVVWAAPHEAPPELTALAQGLARDAAAAGCTGVDLKRPYAPHVTLVRDASDLRNAPPPAFGWPVEGYLLMASERTARGVSYRALGSWPSGGTPA